MFVSPAWPFCSSASMMRPNCQRLAADARIASAKLVVLRENAFGKRELFVRRVDVQFSDVNRMNALACKFGAVRRQVLIHDQRTIVVRLNLVHAPTAHKCG